MPASAESVALAEAYRRRTVALRRQFVREFATIWPGAPALFNPSLREAWLRLVIALIGGWRPIFRRAALDFYRRAAELDTGAVPTVLLTPAPAPPVDAGEVVGSMFNTAAQTILKGHERGQSLTRVEPAALARSAEGAARLALAAGRDAIEETVTADRLAVGWMRVTDTDPCDFCLMLASRGPVYESAEAAGFELDPVRGPINRYHDRCGCQAVPVFTRAPVLPPTTRQAQQTWQAAQQWARESGDLRRGTDNDALNALRRFRYESTGR